PQHGHDTEHRAGPPSQGRVHQAAEYLSYTAHTEGPGRFRRAESLSLQQGDDVDHDRVDGEGPQGQGRCQSPERPAAHHGANTSSSVALTPTAFGNPTPR